MRCLIMLLFPAFLFVAGCDSDSSDDRAVPEPEFRITQVATLVQVTAVAHPYFQVAGVDPDTGAQVEVLYRAVDSTVFIVEFESCSNHQAAWLPDGFNTASPRGGDVPNTLVVGDFVGVDADTTQQDPLRGAYTAVSVFVDHPNCLDEMPSEVTTPTRSEPR